MNMIRATCGNHQWTPIPSLCTQLHLQSHFTNDFISKLKRITNDFISEMKSTLEKYEIARYQR